MVKMIFAVEEKTGLIGDGGELPWRFKEDLEFFRKVTNNQIVICGKTTFDSLPDLPNRSIIVCTHDEDIRSKTSKKIDFVVDDIEAFFEKRAFTGVDIYVIGGAAIYEKAAKYADQIIITRIKAPNGTHFEGDKYIFNYQKNFKFAYNLTSFTAKNLKEGPLEGEKCKLTIQVWERK